jgi:predicted TIM-barrel fold metal-dependent hydrolase
MKLSPTARRLFEALSELSVVDAHEHLPPEDEYLRQDYSGPNLFAGGYIQHDLASAGMETEFKETLRAGGHRPVESWWPKISPFWGEVRHTSYARALLITVRDLYAIGEINDETIHALAEGVKADNTAGLYQRLLYDRCNIRKVITCLEEVRFPKDPLFCGLSISLGRLISNPQGDATLAKLSQDSGIEVKSLHDAKRALRKMMQDDLKRGAVGFKISAADHGPPDQKAARAAFERAQRTSQPVEGFPALRDYLFDAGLDVAVEAGVPVAVHSGYWEDFRSLDPKFLLGFARRRQDVHFDLFHLGVPMIRDSILIGKNLPNVTLNLTWCPIISQVQTVRALDEILDQVPTNKVIAFGGDYAVAVQKVWGHLVMARECVAAALAKRIESDAMDEEEALRVARAWFYENPKKWYKLHL